MSILDLITILVFLAAAFTYINIHFLKLPSTIGLMIMALLLSVITIVAGYFHPPIQQTVVHVLEQFDFKEVLLDVMLSFLLFAGALGIDLNKLAEHKWTILSLAIMGTLISTFIVGGLMFYVFELLGMQVAFPICLVFGALISPTDPIAVLALVKKIGVSKDLEIKIAGESLFNDGIGVVLFLTLLNIAFPEAAGHGGGGEGPNFLSIASLFVLEVGGGLLLGCLLGLAGFRLLKAIDNNHVELEVLVTLSLVMAGTKLAELSHVSAPLAMVVMGLFLGNKGRSQKLSTVAGEYVFKFWHLLDEALNAILFILIGLEMVYISDKFRADYFSAGVIAIVVVLLARFVGVATPIKLFSGRKFGPNTIAILSWGGLRGGISVALALSLPQVTIGGVAVTNLIIATTYSVVVFSILVQGLTISSLVRFTQEIDRKRNSR